MHRSFEVDDERRHGSSLRAGGVVLLLLAVVAACLAIAGSAQSRGRPASGRHPRGTAISPFRLDNGEGAAVSGMTEYEAEDAVTNAVTIGPSYAQGYLANEASGRAAVQLRARGQYVQFKLTARANALDVSYSLPPGTSGSLAVYVNGTRLSRELPLSSRYSYIPVPGGQGSGTYHFFNDARILLGRQLAAGDTVRLQAGSGGTAVPYTIDVADFYQVPAPARQPRGSVSVIAEGADPTGKSDSAAAFRKAIAAGRAAGRPVWIPPGTFLVSSPLRVGKATIAGAGDWYAQIRTSQFIDNTAAVTGPVNLSGFAILGPAAGGGNAAAGAISGSLGAGSTVNGLWIQDTSAGIWLRYRNASVIVENCEILATATDGLNLDGDTTGSWLRNNFIRNTGADGLAIWSDSAITISDNTIVQANRGNGIAEYGGTGTGIIDNVVADTSGPGSGIAISNQKLRSRGFTPLAGTITVGDNTVLRSGAINPSSSHPTGAIRIDSYDYPVRHVTVNFIDNTVEDSPYSAFEIVSGRGAGLPVTGVNFTGDTINGIGTVAFQAETGGSGTVSGIAAAHIGVRGVYDLASPAGGASFTFKLGTGNTGWSATPVLTTFPRPAGPAAPPSPGRSATPGHLSHPPAPHSVSPSHSLSPSLTPTPSHRLSPRPSPSPSPSRSGPTLTASASSVPDGATVTFRYSTPRSARSSANWIAIYSAGEDPGQGWDTAYKFTTGASGSVTFSTGSFIGTGSYDAYYFYNDTYQVLAGPVSLSVIGANPTLTASASSVRNGATVTFRYSAPPGMRNSTSWIGIYLAGQVPSKDSYTAWHVAPGATGSVTFSTSSLRGPGSYDAYLFYKGGYVWLAGPVSLSVTSS